jgi:ribosome-associated protein
MGRQTSRRKRAFPWMERWRTRLMAESEAVSGFIEAYPHVDSQRLRTLIRNAQREEAANKPPKSSRELFKLIRETLEAQVARVVSVQCSECFLGV